MPTRKLHVLVALLLGSFAALPPTCVLAAWPEGDPPALVLTSDERGELERVVHKERAALPLHVVLAELDRVMSPSETIDFVSIQDWQFRLIAQSDPSLQLASRIDAAPYFAQVRLVPVDSELLHLEGKLETREAAGFEGETALDPPTALLPYRSEGEAVSRIEERLREMAGRHDMRLEQVQSQPAADLSAHFQRVVVEVRATAPRKDWQGLLRDIEASGPGLAVCSLRARAPRYDAPGDALFLQVCGILLSDGSARGRGVKP